jgi:hypothetical protein
MSMTARVPVKKNSGRRPQGAWWQGETDWRQTASRKVTLTQYLRRICKVIHALN